MTCSYIKRRAEGMSWADAMGKTSVAVMRDVAEEVKREDPVRGK